MRETFAIFFLIVMLGLAGPVSGQQYPALVDSLLQAYENKESAPEKLAYFFQTKDRYSSHSAYDWLDRINADLGAATREGDSAAMQLYRLMRAQVYFDLGNYKKAATLADELYPELEAMEQTPLAQLLDLMDQTFGKLRQYDQQIEIRKRKKQFGITEGITFYDIYDKLGLHRKAMREYINEVKRTIDSSDFYKLAQYNNNIGQFLLKERSGATAMTYFKQAQGYVVVYLNDINQVKTEEEITNSNRLKGRIEGNIGKAHILQNQYREALPYLENSLGILRNLPVTGDQEAMAENALDLAEAHMKLGNLDKAGEYLKMELEMESPELMIRKNRLLATYSESLEDYASAARFLRNSVKLEDSIGALEAFNEKQRLVAIVTNEELESMKVKNSELKTDIDRRRAELQAQDMRINLVFISLVFTLLGFAGLVFAYLKSIKTQRLIAEQNRIIENSLVEKDSLLKEIHHRVKNNLQMVSSLLSLQTKNTRSKAAIEALEEGKTRVKAMALIHQKLYQNDDLSVIEMQGYIESLINSIQSVFRKGGHNINITIDAEGVELDIDRAIPIGLILNELVSNSFKYAFPEDTQDGKIYIHIQKNGEGGFFEYTDNGVGLPDDTEDRESTSMGIRLIKRLVNQLQSTLNIDKTAEGVRFWFNFK